MVLLEFAMARIDLLKHRTRSGSPGSSIPRVQTLICKGAENNA